jgi:N-acetylneuraminic acid mutarotase
MLEVLLINTLYLSFLPLYRLLDSVERYDPQTDTWCTVAAIQVPRIGAAASVLDGKIHLAGGYTTNSTDKSVTSISSALECYISRRRTSEYSFFVI